MIFLRLNFFIWIMVLMLNANAQTSMNCTAYRTWTSTSIYGNNSTTPDTVVYNGLAYKSNFWTQNQQPDLNNGGAGSGQPWVLIGSCSATGTTGSTGTTPPSYTWNVDGNAVTDGQFLGTTLAKPLILKANNKEGLYVNPEIGSVSIGKPVYPTYYKFEVNEGLSAFSGPNSTNQNNLLVLYSGNKNTSAYLAGKRHYIGFSHGLFGTEEYGIMNAYEYSATSGTGKGKHLLIQNTAEGNLGIGVFTSAPTHKLHIMGAMRWGNAILTPDQGGSIELGGYNGSGTATGVPYIDFHGNNTNSDFNVRLINDENGTLSVVGLLKVKGPGIVAKQICVNATYSWCDYVFENTYQLMPLKDLKNFIAQHHHLPEIPSAVEIEKDGINLNQMATLQMKKIEELTLYILQQQQQMDALEERLKQLELLLKK
jgi:hypothetical protein